MHRSPEVGTLPDVDDIFEPIVIKAQILITQLLNFNSPRPSDPIIRQLNLEGIQDVQNMSCPSKEPQDLADVLQEALSIFANRLSHDHPNCFAYIPAAPSPFAWVGDLLTSIFNVNAALWDNSSGPSVVERTLIRWLADQVGHPPSAGGCFVSGGSMANLTAIVAARDRMLPPQARCDGIIYLSDQTHISNSKGLHIAGFSADQIRIIPTNEKFRMDTDALVQAILADRKNGRLPFLVIASCGSTNTGSIDPLHRLADIAKEHGLWLHVDGAYGASIALSSRYQHLVDGAGRADSISWDAHKWLFQTYGSGIILMKDATALEDCFKVDAEYIRTPRTLDGTNNFYNLSPELSRPARAMALWFTLRALGHRAIGDMIDQCFSNALAAEKELNKLPNWTVISPATASIVVFRYTPRDFGLAENIAAMMTTTLRGRIVFRFCSMNPKTQSERIASLMQTVDSMASAELSESFKKRERKRECTTLCADSAQCSQSKLRSTSLELRAKE